MTNDYGLGGYGTIAPIDPLGSIEDDGLAQTKQKDLVLTSAKKKQVLNPGRVPATLDDFKALTYDSKGIVTGKDIQDWHTAKLKQDANDVYKAESRKREEILAKDFSAIGAARDVAATTGIAGVMLGQSLVGLADLVTTPLGTVTPDEEGNIRSEDKNFSQATDDFFGSNLNKAADWLRDNRSEKSKAREEGIEADINKYVADSDARAIKRFEGNKNKEAGDASLLKEELKAQAEQAKYAFKKYGENPYIGLHKGAESAGALLAGGVGGKLLSKGVVEGAKKEAKKAFSKDLEKITPVTRTTPDLDKTVAKNEARFKDAVKKKEKAESSKAVGKKVQEAAILGTIVGGATFEAGTITQSEASQIMKTPTKELEKSSPTYRKYREAGLNPEAARKFLAGQKGALVGVSSGIISGLVSKGLGTGALEAKLIKEGRAANTAGKIGNLPVVGTAAKVGAAVVREGIEEGIQEGSQTVLSNALLGEENKRLLQGAGRAAGTGAATGALFSGAIIGAAQIPGEPNKIAQTKIGQKALDKVAKKIEEKTPELAKPTPKVSADELTEINDKSDTNYDPIKAFRTTVTNRKAIRDQVKDDPANKDLSETEIEAETWEAQKAELSSHFTEASKELGAIIEDPNTSKKEKDKAQQTRKDMIAVITQLAAKTAGSGSITETAYKEALAGNDFTKNVEIVFRSGPSLDPSNPNSEENARKLKDVAEANNADKATIDKINKRIDTIVAYKNIPEVNRQVIDGKSKTDSFRGLNEHLRLINRGINVENRGIAAKHLNDLKTFTARHNQKAIDYRKAYDAAVAYENAKKAGKKDTPEYIKLVKDYKDTQANIEEAGYKNEDGNPATIHFNSNEPKGEGLGLIDAIEAEAKALTAADTEASSNYENKFGNFNAEDIVKKERVVPDADTVATADKPARPKPRAELDAEITDEQHKANKAEGQKLYEENKGLLKKYKGKSGMLNALNNRGGFDVEGRTAKFQTIKDLEALEQLIADAKTQRNNDPDAAYKPVEQVTEQTAEPTAETSSQAVSEPVEEPAADTTPVAEETVEESTLEKEIHSEMDDISLIMNLLNIEGTGINDNIPPITSVISSLESTLAVLDGPINDLALQAIAESFIWLKTKGRTHSEARKTRATKKLEQRAKGDIPKYFTFQLVEELNELIAELIKTDANNFSEKVIIETSELLKLQKLALKINRFGPHTIIKDENNPYNGMTNLTAFKKAVEDSKYLDKEAANDELVRFLTKTTDKIVNSLNTTEDNTTAEDEYFGSETVEQGDVPSEGVVEEVEEKTIVEGIEEDKFNLSENLVSKEGVADGYLNRYFKTKKLKEGQTSNIFTTVEEFYKNMSSYIDNSTREFNSNEKKALKRLKEFNNTFTKMFYEKTYELQKGYHFVNYMNLLNSQEALDAKYADGGNIKNYRTLDPNVLGAMSTVISNWLVQGAPDTLINNESDINKLLGRTTKNEIHPVERGLLTSIGVSRGVLENGIGTQIYNLLDIEAKQGTPADMEARIIQGLGGYAVATLEKMGIIEFKVLTSDTRIRMQEASSPELLTDNEKAAFADEQLFVRLVTEEDSNGQEEIPEKIAEFIRVLNDAKDVQNELFGIESISKPPTFEPVDKPVSKVKRSLMKVAKKSQKVLDKYNKVEWTYNENILDAFEFLNEEQQLAMLGVNPDLTSAVDDITNPNPNPVHLANREAELGKMNEIKRTLSNHKIWLDRVRDESTEGTLDKSFFFSHEIWKTGRIGMVGNLVNPMQSKIMRHLIGIKSHNTTIANDPNSEAFQVWQLAVGEGLGIKVDKQPASKSISQLNEKLKEPIFAEAIETLKSIKHLGDLTDSGSFDNEKKIYQQSIVDAVLEGGEGTYTLHALVSIAEQQTAAEQGKDFVTNIGKESDGITNGTAIALVQFGAIYEGDVSRMIESDWQVAFSQFHRVGLFEENSAYDDYNDYKVGGKEGNVPNNDSYEQVAQLWQREIDSFQDRFTGKEPPYKDQANEEKPIWQILRQAPNALNGLYAEFGEIKRNMAKDPVMTYNYGAGIKSISRNLGTKLIADLHQGLAEKEGIELENHIKQINKLLSKGNPFRVINHKPGETTLSPSQQIEIQNLVLSGIGYPLDQAMISEFGQISKVRNEMTAAMEVVGDIFMIKYKEAVDTVTEQNKIQLRKDAEKYPDTTHKGRIPAPSKEQQAKIFRDLKEYMPAFMHPLSDSREDGISVLKSESTIGREALPKKATKEEIKANNAKNSQNLSRTNVTEGYSATGWVWNEKLQKYEDKVIPSKKSEDGLKYSYSSPISLPNVSFKATAAAVNGVQAFDSAIAQKVIAAFEELHLHDAGMFNLNEAMEGTKLFNQSYIENQANYSLPHAILDTLTNSLEELGKDNKRYTHVIKEINERISADRANDYGSIKELVEGYTEVANRSQKTKEVILERVHKTGQYNGTLPSALYNNHQEAVDAEIEANSIESTDLEGLNKRVGVLIKKFEKEARIAAKLEAQKKKDNTLGSTPDTLNVETFESDYENTFLLDQVENIDDSEAIFNKLRDVGNKPETEEHSLALMRILDNLVHKVFKPISLYRVAEGQVTHGAIQGSKVYIKAGMGSLVNGLQMSAQEVYVHELIHHVTGWGLSHESAAKREVKRLWQHVKNNDLVTPEDFLNRGETKETASTEDWKAAVDRYKYIFKNESLTDISYTDPQGYKVVARTNPYLHEFMALGLSNARLKAKLDTIQVPFKSSFRVNKKNGVIASLFDTLSSIFDALLELFDRRATQNRTNNASLQMEILAKQLTSLNENKKRNLFHHKRIEKMMDTAAVVGLQKFVVAPIVYGGKGLAKHGKHGLLKTSGALVAMAPDINFKEYAANVKATSERFDISKDNIFQSLITEGQGITEVNSKYMSHLRKSAQLIDQLRKHTDEQLQTQLKNMWRNSRGADDREKVATTHAAIMTDLSAIWDKPSDWKKVQGLFNDNKLLDKEIKRVEKSLYDKATVNKVYYKHMAHNLGYYMANRKSRAHQASMNATQIYNVIGKGDRDLNTDISNKEEIIKLIDELATLSAIANTHHMSKRYFSNLMGREFAANPAENAITFLMDWHKNYKEEALATNFHGQTSLMHKGYTKERFDPNVEFRVVVHGSKEYAELMKLGFTSDDSNVLTDDIVISRVTPKQPPMVMMVNNNAGLQTNMAGTFSLTNQVAAGTNVQEVDMQSGTFTPFWSNKKNIDQITRTKVSEINKMYSESWKPINVDKQNIMIPTTSNSGKIVDYRYMAEESMRKDLLKRDDVIERVIGGMDSAILDKANTETVNSQVIKLTQREFQADKNFNPNKYVEIGKESSDKDGREIYYLMPESARREMREVWGDDKMYVRKDMYRVIFGFRKFSIGQLRLKDSAEGKGLNKVIQLVNNFLYRAVNIHPKARGVLLTSEKAWQEFVSLAKDAIVVKSGIVLLGNTISNFLLLVAQGVPINDIVRYHIQAYRGARQWNSNRTRIATIDRLLKHNPDRANSPELRVELAQLHESQASNNVRELMEAGLLQSIVEDVEVGENKQFSWRQQKIDKVLDNRIVNTIATNVPGGLKALGKEGLLMHGSRSYNTMLELTQLSDFVARYTLHNHNTKKLNKTPEASLEDIVNKFINYDVPTHVFIQYLNDIGLFMFSKFFIRIQRIIWDIAVEHPARSLMLLLMQDYFGNLSDIMDASFITDNSLENRLHFNPFDITQAIFTENAYLNLVKGI